MKIHGSLCRFPKVANNYQPGWFSVNDQKEYDQKECSSASNFHTGLDYVSLSIIYT